nr:unnamed protein product [Callosobruchus chinensis]
MAADVSLCPRCSDNFVVKTKFVECKNCKKLYHQVCVNLKDDAYKVITKVDNIHWFCGDCDEIIEEKLSETVPLALCRKEIECLQREKKLCEDMITEMRLSNNLLKDKVEELQHNIKSYSASKEMQGVFVPGLEEQKMNPSYSSALKKNINSESQVLLIKARDGKSQQDVMKILTETVNPAEFNICVNGTRRINHGAAVFCKDAADLEKLQNVVKAKLGNKFNVNQSQKLNPRIIIRNVKLQGHTDESFAANFISANELTDFNASDVQVIVKFKALEKDHYNIVVEVPPQLRKRLVDRGFAYFGWKRCSVGDNLYVLQCRKCMKFGHHHQNCRGTEACSKCSEVHNVKECRSDEIRCVSCSMYNDKYKTKLSINHLATDKHCQMYQNYVLHLRSRINYG